MVVVVWTHTVAADGTDGGGAAGGWSRTRGDGVVGLGVVGIGTVGSAAGHFVLFTTSWYRFYVCTLVVSF